MKSYLERLTHRHRRINRLIDTTKAAGSQEHLKLLKRVRLRLRDEITELQNGRRPSMR